MSKVATQTAISTNGLQTKGKGGKAAATKAPGEMSKAQKKKAAKKAKKLANGSFCWYCEREFEDDKILLTHQKAKHFRCPHCPRRLNTAGGLAVHIDQVHKTEPTRLENTLPGRDSFDIEIYGMEGIPKEDLLAWRRKKDAELGIQSTAPHAKRPKIFKGVIGIEELAKQLAVHRQVMRNSALSGAGIRVAGAPVPILPGGAPGIAPPPFALPGGVPMPPPGMFPMPPSMMPLPPAGFASPAPAVPGASPLPVAQAPAVRLPPYTAPSSRTELKSGQVMVYGDNDISVEEKRAKNPKYALTIPTGAPSGPIGAPKIPSAPAPISASVAAKVAPESPQQVIGQKRARATDFL